MFVSEKQKVVVKTMIDMRNVVLVMQHDVSLSIAHLFLYVSCL